MEFLKTSRTQILCREEPVRLRGVNLGGWLMMEGYILHAPNLAEGLFKKTFKRCLGKKALAEFEEAYRDHFIREDDFRNIAALGFNCVRVPFHYKIAEKRPGVFKAESLQYLDNAVDWAGKYGLWVILDLHAAPGSQNHDWHSDSLGQADLWKNKSYRHRAIALWEFLADRYKNEPAVAGYDVLNEAVTRPRLLNAFYRRLVRAIRRVDKQHILFVEGNNWATDIHCLEDFQDDNLVLSVHSYQPLEFTFNFVPQLRYPLKSAAGIFDKENIERHVEHYAALARQKDRPIYVGEFGVNGRGGLYGEDQWLSDVTACFEQAGFHWTYWTYKAVKNAVFPDGLYSYFPDPAWVHRQGPLTGWDTYAGLWQARKNDIMASWQTGCFQPNHFLIDVLKKACEKT